MVGVIPKEELAGPSMTMTKMIVKVIFCGICLKWKFTLVTPSYMKSLPYCYLIGPFSCLQDAAVRQSVQRLYKQIMPHVTGDMIGPLFPVLSAHLCCAMTHIHDDIQLDSLSLLGMWGFKLFAGYLL